MILLLVSSCNSPLNRIFSDQTPHEAYASEIKNDSLGSLWVSASKTALELPHTIELPYAQLGYFHPDKPRALALHFHAKHGERINFELTKERGKDFTLFADIYKKTGTEFSHLLAADTSGTVFGFDVEETGEYILRLQPELFRTGEYNLSVVAGPSLGFPVAGSKARAGSFWGDARDGGKRNHEGIDIFAAKHTPAIAAADGHITRVSEGGIGGKTIWMRADNHDVHLYYAHLDQQLIEEGESVKIGDTLGLVGNTGNAKFTPPHLHFGVYTNRGPVDPLPFVNKIIKQVPSLKKTNLAHYLQLKSFRGAPHRDSLIVVPLALNSKGYIGELLNGNITQLSPAEVIVLKPGDISVNETEVDLTNDG